jgi:hypothetical protein
LPGDSLWDAVERSGIPWQGWNWRTSESEALGAMERALEHGPEDFLFCYTAELDAALHREGAGGAGVRERLARYDAWLRRIVHAARRRDEELRLVLLSDHGMLDVRETLDVMGVLARLSCRWPRDYVPFFDSTFARFWWRSAAARGEVRAALEGVRGGGWLGDDALARAGALFPARDYGEDVYLLDPGVLMVPSFMGSRPLAAMHGYDPAHPEMAAVLAASHPVPGDVCHLKDVRRYLEDGLAWLAEAR